MHLKYISSTRIFSSRFTKIFLLFCACAFIGSSIGKIVSHNTARQTAASAQSSNWGLSFQEEGKRPVGNATIEELAQYNAFFAEDTEEKKIYLTFDAGFENGNTPAILDALKKHQAPATFFVVGNFISENKDLIKRMETEGHIVGNHTMTHPDMSKISTKESFQKELSDVEKIYREITGKEMTKFYRPPQGIYSTQNLSMARELGYHTFFWSLAYVDWQQDDQPTHEEALTNCFPAFIPERLYCFTIHQRPTEKLWRSSSQNGRKWDIPSVRCPTLPKQHKIEKGQLPIRLLSFFIRSFTFYFWL